MGRVYFVPCKLNLGLFVTGKRPDGFHNLESVFLPLDWCDVMEVRELPGAPRLELRTSGLPIPGEPASNLLHRAYAAVAREAPVPALAVHLRKVVPMGAGLGGGSADGAWMLRVLREACPSAEVAWSKLAAQLGSDCPFFLEDGPAFVWGRGERVERWSEGVPVWAGWHVVVLHPGIHVGTRAAFAGITPRPAPFDLRTLPGRPVEDWGGLVGNDFEPGMVQSHPEIGRALATLREAGATYVQMTGTGSAVFGLFAPATPESTLQTLVDGAPLGHCSTLPR